MFDHGAHLSTAAAGQPLAAWPSAVPCDLYCPLLAKVPQPLPCAYTTYVMRVKQVRQIQKCRGQVWAGSWASPEVWHSPLSTL